MDLHLSKINWHGLLVFLRNVLYAPIWVIIFIVTLILLCGKSYIILLLDLNEFYLSYTWVLFLGLLVSVIILLRRFVVFLSEVFIKRKRKKSIIRELEFLNSQENEVLDFAKSENSRTILCGPNKFQSFISLTQKGIMEGWLGDIRTPGTITPFVWERINIKKKSRN